LTPSDYSGIDEILTVVLGVATGCHPSMSCCRSAQDHVEHRIRRAVEEEREKSWRTERACRLLIAAAAESAGGRLVVSDISEAFVDDDGLELIVEKEPWHFRTIYSIRRRSRSVDKE
jgi:hypothetical protein